MLATELGVGSAPETEAPYIDLLAERPQPATDAPEPSPVTLAPVAAGLRRRLVAREAEHKALAEAWDQGRAGHRQVVVVAGEAGMGKTSLGQGFAADAAESGATVLYGRCDREVWTPYQPFVEALGRYVEGSPAQELAQLGSGAPEAGPAAAQLVAYGRRGYANPSASDY